MPLSALPANPSQLHMDSHSQRISLLWDDGHTSTYPWAYLRGYCPCAACQGHHSMGVYRVVENPLLADVSEVGHYALNFRWKDGHETGIYTFELLRQLCPCPTCLAAWDAHHPGMHPWHRAQAQL